MDPVPFARERVGWRVALGVGLAILLVNQFLIWEPWFGVSFLLLDVLLAVGVAFMWLAIIYLRRLQRAIRAGILPPRSF